MKTLKQVVVILVTITTFISVFSLVKWGVSSLINGGISSTKTNSNADETWQPFNSTEGGFKVSFPKYPTTDPSQTEYSGIKMVTTQYSADSNSGSIYIAIYNYYPDIFPNNYDVKKGIEGSINGMVASKESNQLVSSNLVTVGKHQGATYLIYNKDNAVYMRGQLVIVSEGSDPVKQYNLMVASKSSNPDDNFTKFIDSFELL